MSVSESVRVGGIVAVWRGWTEKRASVMAGGGPKRELMCERFFELGKVARRGHPQEREAEHRSLFCAHR